MSVIGIGVGLVFASVLARPAPLFERAVPHQYRFAIPLLGPAYLQFQLFYSSRNTELLVEAALGCASSDLEI